MAYVPIIVFNNGKPKINNECVNILKWYNDLKNLAESEEELMEYVKYIYLAADYGSPFIELDDSHKRCLKALENVNLTREQVNTEAVLYALDEYDQMMSSDTQMGFINDLYSSINSTRSYLRTVDYNKLVESGARKGTPFNNPKDVISIAKDADKVITSLDALKVKIINNVKNRQLEDSKKSTKVRGDRERGFMSRVTSNVN